MSSLWSDHDPTIDIVRRFFAHERRRANGPVARARCDRIRDHLRQYVDQADVTVILGEEAQTMLGLERAHDPNGALLRLLDPIEFVQCLPEFLSKDWLLPNPVDAGRQITLTERLARTCRRAVGSSMCSCCRHHDVVYVAATVARAVLNQDRAGWTVPSE